MSRKKNKTRRPKGNANNRRGARTVGFDGDHFMQGVDPLPTKNRSPANRRGGNNTPFPTRGRGAQPHHNGNSNRAAGPRGGRAQRNNNNIPNLSPHKRKRRNNNAPNASSNPPSDFDMLTASPPPFPFAASPSPPFFLTSNANFNGKTPSNKKGNGGGLNARFCTECSTVRRANLRFRNWAERAIRACGERFREWADDAGVGFESADEMDWQPEPVIRVLLVRPPIPNPNSFLNPQAYPGHRPSLGTAQMSGGLAADPFQQQQYGGNIAANGDLKPGPWPWPPFNWYEDPTVATWSVRVPAVGLPSIPTTAEDVPPPNSGAAQTSLNGTSSGGPIPVSGFGLLGAPYVNYAADEPKSGFAWSAGEPIPARAPQQVPAAITSTCGPAKVGMSSAWLPGDSFSLSSRVRRVSRDSDGQIE